MSTSDFGNLQKKVCTPDLEPPPLKKFCAPCVPNQSYIEPDWEFVTIAEPYLNEKQCEYQITMNVNKYGDYFTGLEFMKLSGTQRSFQSRDLLLRSFIQPAIVLILEDQGRLVADQIICATFKSQEKKGNLIEEIKNLSSFEDAFLDLSKQPINNSGPRCEDFGFISKVDPTEPFDFVRTIIDNSANDAVQNPFALELYARVNDFYIDPVGNQLKVHIAIPSFIIDQVPILPSKKELEEEALLTQKSVKLNVDSLFGQVTRLKYSLQTFGKYQSHFYQTQDGFLKFKESKKDFYSTRMSVKVDKFYSDLKQLAKKNDVNIRSNIPSLRRLNADNVRIEFVDGPNGNPYVIKSIYAWKEGCEEKKLKKGISAFKKEYNKRPTVLNYIAKINDIDMTLQARESTPWLDFLVKYTYPLITVDYGSLSAESVGETMGKCVEENMREFGGELRDYILNEALSFVDSLGYMYSSAASCEDLYSTENQPEVREFEKSSSGRKEGRAAKKQLKEFQQTSPDDLLNSQSNLTLLRERLESNLAKKTNELQQLEEVDDLQKTSESERLELLKKIDLAKKQQEEVQNKLNEVYTKLNTVNDRLVDLTMEDPSDLRKKDKSARKAAAKSARRSKKSHPYTKKAAKIALEEIKKQDTLLSNLIDWEAYEKSGKPSFKKLKDQKDDDDKTKDLIGRLSICNLNALTINAIRCLFSGVTKERAFDKMFKAALQAMDLDVFGFFIGGLPPDKQAELREKFEKQFGNIALPWEEEYDSGGKDDNAYLKYLSSNNVAENNTLRQEIRNLKSNIRDLRKVDGFEEDSPPAILVQLEKELEEKEMVLDAQKGFSGIGTDEFQSLPENEKAELLAQQKEGQGTFGAALGNIQEEVITAYIEYVFDVMNIDEIGDALSQVPGGQLVFNTVDQILKCSTKGLFNPPIKSFLSSLTLDVCGEDRHAGLAFPSKVKEIEVPEFGRALFLTKLRNAFITKAETVLTQVLVMLLLKLFETLDNAICKSLNAIGQAVVGTLTGGTGGGLDEAFADAFCPEADDDELGDVKRNAFGNALGKGAVPDSAYECLFKAVNGTMSKREIIDLLTNTPSNMDDQVAEKFSTLVNSRCPELADLLGSPEDVKDAFGSMGRFIPPELKDFLKEQNAQDLESPIYDAVCLTQDELDLWNSRRKRLYLDNGLDEKTANELIDKANNRALDNLGSLADILQRGPEGLLGDALNALMQQADPACASDPSAIILEEEDLAAEKQSLMNSYFKKIESKFIEDLIGERQSLIGNILIDTRGNHLQEHNRKSGIGDRTILFANYVDTEEQWAQRKEDGGYIKRTYVMDDKEKKRGMFPETVGLALFESIKSLNLNYKTSKDMPQLTMIFETEAGIPLAPVTKKLLLKYKLSHNKKSTQRAYVREEREQSLAFVTRREEDLLSSSKRNQTFNKKQIGLTNYDFVPNEVKLLSDLLKKNSNSLSTPESSKIISFFDSWNSIVLKSIRDSIVEAPNKKYPVGFSFGFDQGKEITFNDLLYVNPDADPNDEETWDYSFKEGDAVLGKSATGNPRVHFLDPSVHGGRYVNPKIYIEPATYDGWLGAIKTFVPQIQTCRDKDEGFLNMLQIAQRAKQVESSVPIDKRLSMPIECRLEVPYDRQIMPANHALIEGIVTSTIRVYAAEFMIRAFPIFGSIQFSSRNVDSLLSGTVADIMQREMSESGIFSNISRLAYYLLFLEQCVQVVQRQIIDGLMEDTEEIRQASIVINRAQSNYEKLKLADLILGLPLPDGVRSQLAKGTKIMAFGNKWEEKSGGNFEELRTLSGYKINLARKVAVIHDTQSAAEVFLFALIEKETTILSKKFSLNLRPMPHVFDIQKYMLSEYGIMEKSNIKSGLATVEQEIIEGGSKPSYGDIVNCADETLQNPLVSTTKMLDDLKKTGFMYLEKYVRVTKKDATYQVMSIPEFQKMISNKADFDENMLLSDYFGNAEITDSNVMVGSIGVKFGVRLILATTEDFGIESNLDNQRERLSESILVGETRTRLVHIPMCYYELDVIDKKIIDVDVEDSNMGEDLKCYIDRLSQEEDFKLLFEVILKTKSFTSLFGIYSHHSFIDSIGNLEVDEERKPSINQRWKRKIFDETKRLLRKQFRSVYNSQDDDNERQSRDRQSNINFLKNLIPQVYLNIGSISFLQRLRIVDANPFDEDGKPCVNEFQKIFED